MTHPRPDASGVHDYDLFDELAYLDALAAGASTDGKCSESTVMVGQGALLFEGGQPDLFDDNDQAGISPSTAVPSLEAKSEPGEEEPLPLNELRDLARRLMNDHGLENWTFAWDRAVRRAGATKWRTHTISLSAPLMRLFAPHEARNTILHEIAHALAGRGEGHGDVWRAKAIEIGARPERCYDSAMPSVEGDWIGTCPVGHTINRHRAPKNITTSCSSCAPRVFDRRYLHAWSWRGVPVLSPGRLVEIIGDSGWCGQRGTVAKVLDTRYLIRLDSGPSLRVPFTLVTAPGDDFNA